MKFVLFGVSALVGACLAAVGVVAVRGAVRVVGDVGAAVVDAAKASKKWMEEEPPTQQKTEDPQ